MLSNKRGNSLKLRQIPAKSNSREAIMFLVVTVTAVLLLLTGCGVGSTEVNLDDYLVFNAVGYDSYGIAECWFDDAAFSKDIEAILTEKDIWNEDKYTPQQMRLADDLRYAYFAPVIDKDSGLSNGDKVEVTTEYDADKYKEIGIRLTGGKDSFEVSGLEPLQDFDPFAELHVTFNGISPLCTVSLSGTKEGLTYAVSQDSGLSLGDSVTITVSSEYGKDFSEFTAMTGLVPTATEKTYVVENAPHYPKSIAEIPDDMKMKMDKKARDAIKNMEATDWRGYYELAGVDFLGYYYRTPKRINLYQEIDYRLYMVYRIKVLLRNGDPYEFYNYWCFKDISILPDGTCTCNLDDYEFCQQEVRILDVTPKATKDGWEESWAAYRGYESLDTIFNQQIAKYLDLYDYESTVKDGIPQSVTGSDGAAQQAADSSNSGAQQTTGSDDTSSSEEGSTEQTASTEEAL